MMRHSRRCKRLLPLAIMALLIPLLAACGGESDAEQEPEADTTTQDVAQSPPAGATGTPTASTPPVTLVPTDPETAASGDVPDNPWGKEIPTGPAPTVPPNPPSDFDKDGDGFYTNEEFAEAIRYRFSEYEWPENYQTTADIIIDGLELDKWPDAKNEAPGEYTIIGMYHQCAWEYTLLGAVHDNDQGLVDESMHQLKDIGLTKNPMSRDEEGKEMME